MGYSVWNGTHFIPDPPPVTSDTLLIRKNRLLQLPNNCMEKSGEAVVIADAEHRRRVGGRRPANRRYGPGIILVGFSSRAKSKPSQLTFGLVGANIPSGLSLNSHACMS
jgi:hypothetical protein